MFRLYALCLLVLHANFSKAQIDSSEINWHLQKLISVNENTAWDVNTLHHIVISQNDRTYKYDSTGIMLFQSSTKSMGKIAQVDARNPMKTMVFSQEQQLISYLDNTLTPQQTEIELMDFNVSFAAVVCTSNQPDKFWVYDQDNSKLMLIGAQKQLQNQTIENTNGLLNIEQFDQLIEHGEYLFCADYQNGIFQFDRYGTLMDRWQERKIDYFQVTDERLYVLVDNVITVYRRDKLEEPARLALPISTRVIDFRIINQIFYLRTATEIWKAQLEIIKR